MVKIYRLFISFSILFSYAQTHFARRNWNDALGVNIFNYSLGLAINLNPPGLSICDKTLILSAGKSRVKIRPKPKGACYGCCKVTKTDIKLNLYSQDETENPTVLPHEKIPNAKYPNFNRNTKLTIYIPGFTEIMDGGSSQVVKQAYLDRNEDFSLILVDWSELVSFPWYINSAVNVKTAGLVLAKFLESYSNAGDISMSNVHLVGFSLGAQVAGFTAKYLRKDLRIPRITGLDPAYPLFHAAQEKYRLNKNDADFIDVIHTDGRNFGFPTPIGHVDFFPNGGTYYQPGCDYRHLINTGEFEITMYCSHLKAYKYYAESVISPYDFPAVKCDVTPYGHIKNCDRSNVTYMGFAADKSYSGSYFLRTNKDSPYGKGETTINTT